MALNEEDEEEAAAVVVVEEEEEEKASRRSPLQKIAKEDHATCQAHFLPNHGKKFVRSAPLPPTSHRVPAARAAPLRHSVNLAHAQPDKDFGINIICDVCSSWRKDDSGVVCQLAGMPGIVLSATPSP